MLINNAILVYTVNIAYYEVRNRWHDSSPPARCAPIHAEHECHALVW